MGTVRSFDWLVSSILKSKPDVDDGFVELFQEKYKQCIVLSTKLWTFVRVCLSIALMKYLPTLIQHIHLYLFVLHKKQGTNKQTTAVS